MPAKNSLKLYAENGFYHLYNRGVEKRPIFCDRQDYSVFLSYLKEYLTPKNLSQLQTAATSPTTPPAEKQAAINAIARNNFAGEIELICFVLMPNHFHFLLRQNNPKSIDKFINSLCTRYTMYFNLKYQRVGKLYQGVYKAVLVETNEQLLHLSRYIHLNPTPPGRKLPLSNPAPSSLSDFLGKTNTPWLKTHYVLDNFSKTSLNNSYLSFLKSAPKDKEEIISAICLDNPD